MPKTSPKPRANSLKTEFFLTTTGVHVLQAVLELKDTYSRITDLAQHVGKSAGTIAHILDRFEEQGLVQKREYSMSYTVCPKTRRQVEVLCRNFQALFCGGQTNHDNTTDDKQPEGSR